MKIKKILDEVVSNEEGFFSRLSRTASGRLRVEGESDGKTFSRYVTAQDREIHSSFFRKEK